jgi:hypothetical protein
LLECQPRCCEARACAGGAHWVLAHESLQMLIRRGAIATRLFELGDRQQGIVGVSRERILHDDAPVVAFGLGGRLRERPRQNSASPYTGVPSAAARRIESTIARPAAPSPSLTRRRAR